jgi:hypothetical protein
MHFLGIICKLWWKFRLSFVKIFSFITIFPIQSGRFLQILYIFWVKTNARLDQICV